MLELCVYELASNINKLLAKYNTVLSPGADEPFYRAANDNNYATIFSNQDFFSSALHELAHWSLAGQDRRELDDFGYWYYPDGRTQEQQSEFFKVEVKPQALEWAYHLAANIPFQYSLDNLHNQVSIKQIMDFKKGVYGQLKHYFESGFPDRPREIIQFLSVLYNCSQPIKLPPETCVYE